MNYHQTDARSRNERLELVDGVHEHVSPTTLHALSHTDHHPVRVQFMTMPKLSVCLLVALLTASGFGEQPFFNGKDFDGWTKKNGDPVGDGWEVVNGEIHRRPGGKRPGDIVTKESFGDFDLSFEWKISPKGNNGIKYRVRNYGTKTKGIEYQLLDDAAYEGKTPPKNRTGSIYGLVAPNRHKSINPPGEYNSSRIVVSNDTILHYLNGKLILTANVGSETWRDKVANSKFSDFRRFGENQFGKIMLTDHGAEVWYRNIKFKALETNVLPEDSTPVQGAIAEFELRDFMGKKHALSDYEDTPILVLAFLGTECPLAKLYSKRLQQLADRFSNDVKFLGVNSNVQDSLTEIAAFARDHEIEFPILKDLGNKLADNLDVRRAPQVVVLDHNRRIRYKGRIDDQYVVGVARSEATSEDLRDALFSLSRNRKVKRPETDAVGCLIGRVPARKTSSESPDVEAVTFCNQISRILQKRCVNCHHEGDIGPFVLEDYDEVAGWGDMLVEVIKERRMPPWHASPDYGHFANDASMPEDEKELVYAWVEAGCPQGNPDDLPSRAEYTDGWQLSRLPDRIIPMSDEAFEVPATVGKRGVPYQYFVVDPEFETDQWIKAAEVQPGNKSVVHHIIVYAQPPESKGRRNRIFLTAYVPGLRHEPLPENSAKMIPAGSKLLFEQHYTPVGSPQKDISQLGLIFADPTAITHEVVTAEVACADFRIPPQDANHEVTATSQQVRYSDVRLRSLSPHMHLRGKSFKYELVTTDGKRETLLDVPAYDFNWQTTYVLDQPLDLPKGAVIHCKAAFDNSKSNLANPNPDKTVRWGDQSWDEMMIGFCDLIVPVHEKRRSSRKLLNTGIDVVGIFDKTDSNGDAKISRDESQKQKTVKSLFDVLDVDKNEELELGEALKALEMMRN